MNRTNNGLSAPQIVASVALGCFIAMLMMFGVLRWLWYRHVEDAARDIVASIPQSKALAISNVTFTEVASVEGANLTASLYPESGNKLVMVSITVTNTDGKPASVSPSRLRLHTEDNRDFMPSDGLYKDFRSPRWDLVANASTVIDAVFEIPRDATPYSIVWSDSIL